MIPMRNILLIILFLEIITKKQLSKKLLSLLESIDQNSYNPDSFNLHNSFHLLEFCNQFKSYFSEKEDKCFESIFLKIVDYNYSNLYFYSGHKIPEIGDESSCLKENSTYLLALLTYKINETSIKVEDKISVFTSKEKANLGICLWNDCNSFIKRNLIDKMDETFKKNLNKIYKIKDIKAIYNYDALNKDKNVFSTKIKIFSVLLLIYIMVFVVLKIIMFVYTRHKSPDNIYELRKERRKKIDYLKMEETNIIKEEENEEDFNDEDEEDEKKKKNNSGGSKKIQLENIDEIKNKSKNKSKDDEENEEDEDNEEDDEENDEEDDNDSKISNDSLFKKEIEQSKIKYIERNLNKMVNNANQGELETDMDDKFAKKVQLINKNEINTNKTPASSFSLINFNKSFLKLIKLKTLTEFKNQIYSNKGLEMITGLRIFFLILITLNTSFNLFLESPSVKQINYKYLQDFLFGSIKFSSFGFYFWIYLDGFVYTFKLMHFVKNDRNFKRFALFMINLIPKIFVFIMIFYGVYYFQKDIGKIFELSSLFEQYAENDYDYKCLKNPFYLLFPFINSIASKNNKMVYNYFNNCYQFAYVVINELYCIILFIIIFYFCYKYKSKILDLTISIIVLLNILIMNLLPYFTEKVKDEKYYLLKYVMGETFSLRYPHTMFNIFFMGVFSGLIYYYHYFSVNDLNSYLNEEYLPFQFLSTLLQFLFKFDWIIKLILVLISLGIIILDCLTFYIVQSGGSDRQILYNFSGFLKFIYLYETPIVIFCCSVLLIFLLFAEDKFQIKAFLGSRIFYIMEKVSFSYICLIQMINLIFLSSSNYYGESWTFLFFYYITCFLFPAGLFMSFIFTLVFELPAKILANNLRGKDMKRKKLN